MSNDTPTRSAKEQFDRQAAHYDSNWNRWSEETLAWMLKAAECSPQDSVLDVATGTGFTALAFAPYVYSVIGIDVSPGMLAQAREQAAEQKITNVTFSEGVAEALPFPEAAFSLVTCRIAPHHFLDIHQFLAETARVLKPNGRLVLVDTSVPDDSSEAAVWQNDVEMIRDPSHVRNYTPNEWRQMTKSAGLSVTESSSAGGGITIPLSDWLLKAGCTSEQSVEVRRQFNTAPESARKAFQIETQMDGEIVFTWQRVALLTVKQ